MGGNPRDASGINSSTTEQEAHKQGPAGTLLMQETSHYESEGRRFESCRARPSNSRICRSFSSSSAFSAANSSGSDRNVTGVGPPVGPFEAPKSGTPRISAAYSNQSPGNPARGPGEGRLKG